MLRYGSLGLDAFFATVRMAVSRAKAHGFRWRTWYVRQTWWKATKLFPLKHRDNLLIKLTAHAEYTINPKLLRHFQLARTAIQT